jgi:curved DNA-binding protein CbpA
VNKYTSARLFRWKVQGYYAILGLSHDANFQEIKKSYRKLAKKFHPDRNKSPHAEETIKKINEALETLFDRGSII